MNDWGAIRLFTDHGVHFIAVKSGEIVDVEVTGFSVRVTRSEPDEALLRDECEGSS